MTKEEVLSKVRKLFSLCNSPNEHEAALATVKARELLFRYNLTVADLPENEMKAAIGATENSVEMGRVIRNWVKGLLIHVARGFDCEHVIRRRHGCPVVLSFIGMPSDAEVAVYTFPFSAGSSITSRSKPFPSSSERIEAGAPAHSGTLTSMGR
jgi:hypothetical protein